jgi:hypothetical protein
LRSEHCKRDPRVYRSFTWVIFGSPDCIISDLTARIMCESWKFSGLLVFIPDCALNSGIFSGVDVWPPENSPVLPKKRLSVELENFRGSASKFLTPGKTP